jgi:CubicO group peptidase (beta-lactamase class C family)
VLQCDSINQAVAIPRRSPDKENAMHRLLRLTALAAALSLSLAMTPAFAADPPAAAPQAAPASAESPITTPGGKATFLMPEGWGKAVQGNAVVLTPPEADGSRFVILDASAADADAAVAEGWKLLGLTPKFMVATDAAPRDGWEQRRFYEYDVPQNAKRVVTAGAYRKGTSWTVVVVDVDQAIAEKRGSQFGKLYQRLQPAGYTRETFAGRTAHRLDEARLKLVTDFVEQMRKEFEVPGVAIGIVQDGKVVLSRGFGVRTLGKPEAVDGDTRFMIASNTKPLTTLMLARLVDAGKLDWNARARDVFPAFKLGSDATTDKVLVKHLICACTGLPRQDFEWLFEGEKQTPQTVMTTLGTMQPTSGFGELFQYSNPMAAAAGYIGGQVAHPGTELGAGYDRAMQELVFDPLGMRNTTFDYAKAQTGNYASPHGFDVEREVEVMGMGLNDTIIASRPAGAAWGTVNDLLKYLQMEIDRGLLPNGERYIGEAALLQRREAQIALGVDRNYAMALMVDKSDGVTVVDHGGDMGGFHSNMMWWPEQKVGAVILTNADEGVYMRGPFKRRLMELMFDGELQAQASAAAVAKANREAFAAFRKLLQVPPDADAIAGLAPRYRNDALGELVVTREDGKARFDVGAFSSEIATQPQPDGSLAFVTIDPVAAGFPFVRADKDGVRKLIVRDGQHEYVFDEVK